MQTVEITAQLFGPVSIRRNGTPVSLPHACVSLFARLLLNDGRPIDRHRLADLVGQDCPDEAARKRLNTAVWRLRRALEPQGAPRDSVLAASGHAISVSCQAWVDAVEFELACAHLPDPREWTAADAERVSYGLDLYQGGFLDGFTSEWALAERGRLADLHLTALVRLAQWHRMHGARERVIDMARRAVAVEPLREDLHRLLMQAYVEAGLPELAVTQLGRCRAILAEELGVEPLPETVAASRAVSAVDPGAPKQALVEMRELERSQAELRRLAQLLDRSVQDLAVRQARLRTSLERADRPAVS
jgi:DNA-binding SARP family transcriptional activator